MVLGCLVPIRQTDSWFVSWFVSASPQKSYDLSDLLICQLFLRVWGFYGLFGLSNNITSQTFVLLFIMTNQTNQTNQEWINWKPKDFCASPMASWFAKISKHAQKPDESRKNLTNQEQSGGKQPFLYSCHIGLVLAVPYARVIYLSHDNHNILTPSDLDSASLALT